MCVRDHRLFGGLWNLGMLDVATLSFARQIAIPSPLRAPSGATPRISRSRDELLPEVADYVGSTKLTGQSGDLALFPSVLAGAGPSYSASVVGGVSEPVCVSGHGFRDAVVGL